MKYFFIIFLFVPAILLAQENKVEILILGSDHLAQIYKEENPNTDILSPNNQKSIDEFNAMISKFEPDAIMIEELPDMQNEIDSLYEKYKSNHLDLAKIRNKRSEIFNIAFNIGKKSNVQKVYCVNAPGGTSQSILDNGDNIQLYKDYGINLRKIVMEKYQSLGKGELSFKDYLTFLNQPEAYNLVYRLRYVVPARVTNGYFKNPDKNIDTTKIDKQHIGAELISIFKNRDYKIYSNIVTKQLETKANRILVIIGVAHIGSLKNIFNEDPDYQVINVNEYLKK
ncbi:hypothetical protein A9P82_11205 [Arachidicoccus ginsenosidimutans]|uniref:DUF5694 domain-containing protein n=1 Tax=Arachidicoccus sp. BS20 TaxID=1850526 RepID=UPI0007F15C32|nr:DUF5694 domain-containing protein [Arachidicoccus sp. BS20]ANI89806.1 hypothetical protein A9P82_11205 [Arachidicoccus sp. BS20]